MGARLDTRRMGFHFWLKLGVKNTILSQSPIKNLRNPNSTTLSIINFVRYPYIASNLACGINIAL